MQNYIYLLIILLLRFPQSFCGKKNSSLISGRLSYFTYGAYTYLLATAAAGVGLLTSGGFVFEANGILISLLGALSLALNLFCSVGALKNGVMILASLASSAGLLIPCIAGIFLFDEHVSLGQFFGILLLLFAGYLIAGYSKNQTGSFTLKTFFLLLGSMISNGTLMLSQKMFSKFLPNTSVSVFSLFTFGTVGIAMLFCMLPYILTAEKRKGFTAIPKKLFLYGTVSSLILFTINQLATIAGKSVPSAIMFPINDGGATIVTAVTAALCFKEKPTLKSTIGLIVEIAALAVINFAK